MATRSQLDQHKQNEEVWKERVRYVEQSRDQALPLAWTQLAVIVTEATLRAEPIAVADRDGFDPAAPEAVLNDEEWANLDGAQLVIGAMKTYIDSRFRLQNADAPKVIRDFVTEGKI